MVAYAKFISSLLCTANGAGKCFISFFFMLAVARENSLSEGLAMRRGRWWRGSRKILASIAHGFFACTKLQFCEVAKAFFYFSYVYILNIYGCANEKTNEHFNVFPIFYHFPSLVFLAENMTNVLVIVLVIQRDVLGTNIKQIKNLFHLSICTNFHQIPITFRRITLFAFSIFVCEKLKFQSGGK